MGNFDTIFGDIAFGHCLTEILNSIYFKFNLHLTLTMLPKTNQTNKQSLP